MSEKQDHDNAATFVAIIILILIFLFAIWYWNQPAYTKENYSTLWLDADVDQNYIDPYIANYYSNNWPYYNNYSNYSRYNDYYYKPYRGWGYDKHRHYRR